tara:strand:- start:404 stop:637 length:234 start_codon:yes stop_codon:yes gene_type:complete
MNKKKEKLRAQVKSRFYYMFWGAATVSVVAGQILVGSGFRRMAESFDRIVDTVVIEIEEEWSPKWKNHYPEVIPLDR